VGKERRETQHSIQGALPKGLKEYLSDLTYFREQRDKPISIPSSASDSLITRGGANRRVLVPQVVIISPFSAAFAHTSLESSEAGSPLQYMSAALDLSPAAERIN